LKGSNEINCMAIFGFLQIKFLGAPKILGLRGMQFSMIFKSLDGNLWDQYNNS
jgi:hypothetical protein